MANLAPAVRLSPTPGAEDDEEVALLAEGGRVVAATVLHAVDAPERGHNDASKFWRRTLSVGGRFTIFSLLGAFVVFTLLPRPAHKAGLARGRAAVVPDSVIEEFDIMHTVGGLFKMLGFDAFKFQCPLPLMNINQTEIAQDGGSLTEQCCRTYDNWNFPYQFPDCPGNCPTCVRVTPDSALVGRPVAGVAAVAWATCIAVQGPASLNGLKVELQAAGSHLNEQGLTGHSMIAPLNFGMRSHDTNLCPRIDDWQVFVLNEHDENIHARVYKSQSAKLAVVTFRGTKANSLKNWEVDADISTRQVHLDEGNTADVHEGFFFAAERVLPAVKRWVNGEYSHTQGAVPYGWKLVFAGHSLGGALAILATTLAEVEGWHRRPDAVVTFGSPRIGDTNLSAWWQARGLCHRLLRVNVYNDAIHWMPFLASMDWWTDLMGCVGDLASCFTKETPSSSPGALRFSDRWEHVCPESELLVPGAMKGVNKELEMFSPLGGVLAHFLSNGLFGYGYGVMNSDVVLHDKECGISPQIFPGFKCIVEEDLAGQDCAGLELDAEATIADVCEQLCCNDNWCEVWQFTQGGKCLRGRSDDCRRDTPQAKEVVAGQRVH